MAHGYAYRSDVRLRKENQDHFGVFEFDLFKLLVVCDGMGGHVGGRQASALAVRTVHDHMARYTSGDLRKALSAAIEAANHAIHDAAHNNYQLMGMGTTITAAVIHRQTCHVAWVGDSRAYLASNDELRQITRDHTMVNLFVDAELLSPEDAATHPEAHVLSRSLGVERTVEVDVAEPIVLAPSDRLLLCSDGVHGVTTSEGLAQLDWQDPQAALSEVFRLIEQAEGDDNATLVVFGPEVAGATMSPTKPPDPKAIAKEAQAAAGSEGVSATRRSTFPAADDLSEDVSVMDEAEPTVSDDQSPAARRRSLPSKVQRAPAKPTSKVPLAALAGAGLLLASLGVMALALQGNQMQGPAPSEDGAQASLKNASSAPTAAATQVPTLSAKLEANPVPGRLPPVHFPAAPLIGSPTCLDCSVSWAPPLASPYLSSDGDPSFLPAFFDLELPPPPRRSPVSGSRFDRRPPGGPSQVAAAQAVRSHRCREALDTVATAVAKSVDYAALYNSAWFCFNDTHQAAVIRARAETFEDLLTLLPHLEGDRGVRVTQIEADTADPSQEDLSDTDLPPEPQWAWTWHIPAVSGLEYRLARYLDPPDGDAPSLREILHDLQGDGRVADDLAADLLIQVSVAAAIAQQADLTPEMVDVWARRVYVATRLLRSEVGAAVSEWRADDLQPVIDTLYTQATEGDLPAPVRDALQVARGPATAAPPIAQGRIATLASRTLSEDLVTDVDDGADRPTRGDRASGSTASARASAGQGERSSVPSRPTRRAARPAPETDGHTLKVWYPHRSEPVLLSTERRPSARNQESTD